MKPDQLRYFLEAARHQHLGRAASAIPISQSAVSHSIAALEKELGRDLFLKQGKHVFLTEHGKRLAEHAEKLLRDMEDVREELSSERIGLRGHYRIGATHILCARLLAPAWMRLQHENPHLSAEVYTLRSAQVLRDTVAGALDFALCLTPQPHPDLHAEAIHSSGMVFAVREGHSVLRLRPAARLEALSRYPAALPKAFEGISNCESHPMFKKFGLVPRTQLLFDSYEIAAASVTASDIWCLIPDWMAPVWPLKTFVPPGWEAPAIVTALWPKTRFASRTLSRLVTEVRTECRLLVPRRRG